MMAHACTLSIWETEAGRAGVQEYPWLHQKFKASGPYLDKKGEIVNDSLTVEWRRIQGDIIVLSSFQRKDQEVLAGRTAGHLQKQPRTGEMAQELSAGLTDVWGLVLSHHTIQLPVTPASVNPKYSSGLYMYPHT